MRSRLAPLALLLVLLVLPASADGLTLEPVGTFTLPIDVAAPPGDTSRLFVVERGGTVRVIKDGARIDTPFLTIAPSELSTNGERGLLAMTFAPDYATSGRLYTYSTDAGGDIRVDEWQRSANPDVASPVRALVLRIEHSLRSNHNGGDLHFGPDGMLYISTGDGGGGDDPDGNGQTLIRAGTADEQSTALLGKLLRVAPTPGGGYTIPADNPFAGRADARGEIWAYGLRNPFRFSFDRATGDLLIGDVGQDDAEEVNFAAAPAGGRGANFGWKCFEGTLPNDGTMPPCTPPGHVAPVFQYDKAGCQAITGGYVVRDPGLPSLLGRYVYADYCDGVIRSIVPSTGAGDAATGLDVADFTLSSFGEDACGRIYVVQLSGAVSRLVDGTASPCPATPNGTAPPSPPGTVPGLPGPVDGLPATPDLNFDADGDGVGAGSDRCPAVAHRTSDGCPAFVRLTVTSPQRSALTGRVSVRRIASNLSGRLTLTGRLRHRGRSTPVRLSRATLDVVAGRSRSGSLPLAAPMRRIITRRLRSGRVDVDITATLAGRRATARVRLRAR